MQTTRTIEDLRRERREREAVIKEQAARAWDKMDENQRTAVRFGMFPAEVMRESGLAQDALHAFTCALMDCASRNGGMRA